jgi:hypothetical protein
LREDRRVGEALEKLDEITFLHLGRGKAAAYKDVVAPNVNTLYSSIWLDLTTGPIVVHLPDTHGRYYVMEILDVWTNVIGAPGKRTTGTAAQDIAIVGPTWKGQMPAGTTTIVRSPTSNVWVIATSCIFPRAKSRR